MRRAQEVFISTSGGGVLPLTQPGPISRRLVQTYWDWNADAAYGAPIDDAA